MIQVNLYSKGKIVAHKLTSVSDLEEFIRDLPRMEVVEYHANVFEIKKGSSAHELIAIKPYGLQHVIRIYDDPNTKRGIDHE